MKLTDKKVRNLSLPDGKADAIFWDDDVPGFGVRLRGDTSRTYVVQYKIGTKNRRLTLGVTTAITTTGARERAKDVYARVRLGEDPARSKAEARAKAGQTFGKAVEEFLAVKKKHLRASSYADLGCALNEHSKPLHGLAIDKVSRADVAACLNAVEKKVGARTRDGARTRNKVRGHISALYAWAIAEGLVENNPVIGTRRADQKPPRERVFSAAELKIIWRALPDSDYGAIIKPLLLTGQRQKEIAGLRRSEIRGDVIELPPERTKNNRGHRVPLAPAALVIIEAQSTRLDPNTGEPRDLIFGTGEGGFSGWSRAKATLTARIQEMTGQALPHWTPHDLRRSFVTHCNEIGIPPQVVEQCVNHLSGHRGGVAGIYNRATLEPEKRSAMLRWADTLLEWVGEQESNVTPLRRPA